MIVKKLASLMMLVVLAGLTAGDVCAAPKKNANKRETTKTTAKSNAKTSKAAKAAPSKTEDIPAPVDEDQFVADNLAQSGTGILSKHYLSDSDSQTTNEVEEQLKKSSNYNTMPLRYRKLIDANKDKYFFTTGNDRNAYVVFDSEHFFLYENHNRTIIKYSKLESSDLMAIFEPTTVKNSKTAFVLSKSLIRTLSEEDKEYAQKLSDVVNEVITYLFEVPFFIPDKNRLDRGDYDGKFIPEKYLVRGKKIDKISPELYDPNKKGLYKRWGLPVYDISQIETGKIMDPSGCSFYSEYMPNHLIGVNELVLINIDSPEDGNRDYPLDYMRKYPYKQALSLLEKLGKVPDAERQVNATAGKLNKDREQMIAEIEKHLQKIIPPAEKTLNDALQQKKFIYSLNNPQGKPKKIELKDAGIAKTEYTTGNVRN